MAGVGGKAVDLMDADWTPDRTITLKERNP